VTKPRRPCAIPSKADAPEIDDEVHLRDAGGLKPGDIVSVGIEEADEHDLYGVPV
jgi:ribosomal protein S12 methylthiotransferase